MMLAPPSPNHLRPSPSPTQTTFSSLRKMPSSIFHRNEPSTKRSATLSKPAAETINSLAPKEKKKSRMGLGILGWGGASSQEKSEPPPAATVQPAKPIETVRTVGEAFVRVQAEQAIKSETMRASGLRGPLPSPLLRTEPLRDEEAVKPKPRLAGVAGIARRASNLSLLPKLSPPLPSAPADDRRSTSDPISKPTTQRRTSNSSSIASSNASSQRKQPVKSKGGVAGVWERIAGGKKRSIKEEIESQMGPQASHQTPPSHVVKLKLKDGDSERIKPAKLSLAPSRYSGGNISNHSASSSTSSDFTNIATPSTIPILSISRPSFEGILSRPLLFYVNASYDSFKQTRYDGLPQESVTNLPPPLRSRSKGASSVRPPAGIWESVVGDLAHDNFVPTSTIEAAFGKAVPKRKSLTGLFGHFGSPHSEALLDEVQEVVQTPSRQTRDRKAQSEQMGLVDSIKKRLDFSKKQSGIDHVACATDSLCDLVTRFDLSATPSPASKCTPAHSHKRSPDVPQDVSCSPTPMRRMASMGSNNVLTSKDSASPVKLFVKGGISPFKVAMSRATGRHQRENHLPRLASDNVFAPSGAFASVSRAGFDARRPGDESRPKLPLVFKPSQLPLVASTGEQTETIVMGAPNKVVDQLVGMGMTMGPVFATRGNQDGDSDVPGDLRVMLADIDKENTATSFASSLDATITMSLPPMPPADRISPRRPGQLAPRSPPRAPLPASPQPQLRVHAPQLSMDLAFKQSVRESFMSDGLVSILSDEYTTHGGKCKSFDFTGEFAQLNASGQRTSFLEQLHAFGHDLPEELRLVAAAAAASASAIPAAGQTMVAQPQLLVPGAEASEERPNKVSIGALNRDFKFGKASTSPVENASFDTRWGLGAHADTQGRNVASAHPALPLAAAPDHLCPPGKSSTHARDESLFSIASMSSLGTVINTGIAGVFTNVFDADFARVVQFPPEKQSSLADDGRQGESFYNSRPGHTRDNESIDSAVSTFSFHAPGEEKWRPGHRRSFSIDSRSSMDARNVSFDALGPPNTLYNKGRIGYSKSHRRSRSTDSQTSAVSMSLSLGRPDWAAHRRNRSSVGSNRSSISISRLGRPGLGERMFHSDRERGYLPSIMASPAGDSVVDDKQRDSMASYDSLLDDSSISRDSLCDSSSTAYDSIFDVSRDHAKLSSISSDSVFGSASDSLCTSGFALKGLRPLSTVSTLSGQAEDTFINFADNTGKRHVALQASPTATRGGKVQPSVPSNVYHERDSSQSDISVCSVALGTGRSLGEFSRPRPVAGRSNKTHRRRPPTLQFQQAHDSSESDISLLISSNSSSCGSSIGLGQQELASRARPRGAGHARGALSKSSAGVRVQATIAEENTQYQSLVGSNVPDLTSDTGGESDASSFLPPMWSTPGAVQTFSWLEQHDVEDLRAVRGWREWEREAEDVYRTSKSSWADSEESRSTIADFSPPTSPIEIARFIARSTEEYRPLAQLPLGDRMRHRRSSSLSNSRALASPYPLPLPTPVTLPTKNKTSLPLPTKFERTNSATSSVFSFAYADEDTASQPPSAIFAKFVVPPAPMPAYAPAPNMTGHPAPDRRSSPPVLRDLDPLSPFQMPYLQASPRKHDKTATKANDKGEKRSRVTSSARRQALGWGRRRTSDGEASENKANKPNRMRATRPVLAGLASAGATNKENETTMASSASLKPSRTRSRKASQTRNAKPVARAVTSLRV